jgi:hypothetical protein
VTYAGGVRAPLTSEPLHAVTARSANSTARHALFCGCWSRFEGRVSGGGAPDDSCDPVHTPLTLPGEGAGGSEVACLPSIFGRGRKCVDDALGFGSNRMLWRDVLNSRFCMTHFKPRFGGAFFALRKARSTVARGAHNPRDFRNPRFCLGAWACFPGWGPIWVLGPQVWGLYGSGSASGGYVWGFRVFWGSHIASRSKPYRRAS